MDSAVAPKAAELPRERKRKRRVCPHGDAYSGDRRRARDYAPSFFQDDDVLDSLGAQNSCPTCKLMDMLEDVGTPQTGAVLSSTAAAPRLGWWVAKEDSEAMYMKVPMPGLGKEHVKVRVEQNILLIKGEGEKGPYDADDDSAVPTYSRRVEIPAHGYKMDKIKAEMKNGVLWVTVPKVKEEERNDAFELKVE